jgi:hypothetical protein
MSRGGSSERHRTPAHREAQYTVLLTTSKKTHFDTRENTVAIADAL